MTERDLIKKNEKLIAHIFDNYFGNSKKTWKKLRKDPNFDGHSLSSITDYFKGNESVINIKEKYDTPENSVSFTLLSKENII